MGLGATGGGMVERSPNWTRDSNREKGLADSSIFVASFGCDLEVDFFDLFTWVKPSGSKFWVLDGSFLA